MTRVARCHDCSKTYTVPHAEKRWRCKICKGVLELDPEPETSPDVGESECPSCGAIFFGNEAFCEECGEGLASPKEASARRRKDTSHAASELRKATRRVSRFKIFITLHLVFAVLGFLAVLLIVFARDLSLGQAVLILAIQTVLLAFAIFARVYFDRRPFPILVILASVQTLSALLSFFSDKVSVSGVIWAAALWGLAIEAAQIARLAEQYPDLYISKRMRGEHLSASGAGSRKESAAQRRIRQDRARAKIRFWTRFGVVAGVLILAGAGFVVHAIATAPPPIPSPDAAIERFKVAWNAGDQAAIANEAKESSRAKFAKMIRKASTVYEWGDEFPFIESETWSEGKAGSVRVRYESEGGDLEVAFRYIEERWHMVSINTSDVKEWRPGN